MSAVKTRTTMHVLHQHSLSSYCRPLLSSLCASSSSRASDSASSSTQSRMFTTSRKYFQSNLTASTMNRDAIFADGVRREALSPLLQSLIEEKQWTLDEQRSGVAKTYYFKTYTKCLDFTQVVGIRSKSRNHHSTITIKSGSVHIHWTTHFPRGLTEKDIDMAQYCDQQAALIGTVNQTDANKCKPTS